jgi:hypothetical protein
VAAVEGDPVLHTAKKPEHEIPRASQVPDFAHLLPEGIRQFTTKGVYDLGGNEHLSFTQGGGHGGSHPHLVHEFLRALVEDREPWPNAKQSANWTCVGILAHESAMAGGVRKDLPSWTLQPTDRMTIPAASASASSTSRRAWTVRCTIGGSGGSRRTVTRG